MKALRVVGVTILSIVDALVPSVLATLTVFFFVVDPWVDAANPLLLSAGAGAIVFVGTLVVGFAMTMLGQGPFPVTRLTKRLWQWWHRPWFAGSDRRGRGR
ncbi:hypothetical protein C475_09324 [Halosimplex carlsbadense 2-9-1]|uniref:Uncharacterized protein n=1 Tax=Halosimplex carlsbadense 2-9-1 TaxID=797114 RepID=M0CSM7_9EURY|nr:hypothetical protein [Halosimplex carlsbadense]ELZ25648.1 hypothetical protein C475_09324 [Halosimplex carlsbadense 2-9-1]